MNIVTGVFVEAAMRKGREDQDNFLINNVRELFRSIFADGSGRITWIDFESHLDERVMQDYFVAVDLDRSEAKGLFHLLDMDGNGFIDVNEFLSGCLRLRGPAKSLDMQLLLRENRRALQKVLGKLTDVFDTLSGNETVKAV